MRTGPFGIGTLIHVIHVSDDIRRLNSWYEDVFGGLVFHGLDEPSYLDGEKRWASLLMVSDYCVETVSPQLPADPKTAFGRYFERHGAGLHSLGYVADDLNGLAQALGEQDVNCALQSANGMTWFFPRPRDVGGTIIEFIDGLIPEDPRLREEWSSLRRLWASHPLTIEGLSHVTIAARDAAHTYEIWDKLFAPVFLLQTADEVLKTDSWWFDLGDSVVELAQPSAADSPLHEQIDRIDNAVYSVSLAVRDLDSAERHLQAHNIRTNRPASAVLLAEPDDCFNARYQFVAAAARAK